MLHGCLGLCVVLGYSCLVLGVFAPFKRLAGNIVSAVTYNVNLNSLNALLQ